MKNIIPSLLPIPRFIEQGEQVRLPHARKVFPLRNIHFRDVRAVGFDMDYTLSHYKSPEIEELAYCHSVRLLVTEKGYPARLLDTHFDPAFAIRGLVLDGSRGNLLKLDSARQVVRACHGSRPLGREEVDAIYGRRRLVSRAGAFRSIDTLFEIPECHLYAVLVDALDGGELPGRDYLQVFQDVRWAIDSAHRNGVMKAEILANRELFILRDPDLPTALDRWKRAGKKLFVVSNSEWSFTEGVLSFLLDGQDPARPLWTDYFDLVVVSSRKPVFFLETPPAEPLPGQKAAYSGGNALWMEELLDARGEEILYVGDHIYGDILRSKKNVSWHTMLLIPELAWQLEQLEEQATELQDFLRLESARRKSEIRASLLENLYKRNREHRHLLAPRVSHEALQALDLEARAMKDEIDASRTATQAQALEIASLDARLESTFNARWGSIFRDGYEQTRFADQIQTYACAYTGRISNLYLVDPSTALYAPVPTLPHERI
ncbi:HAD-IG family 5'-nucleotidase [Geothrix sp. 21YS21S-2]|uniref:HAD-IG family 5'-nucleotidase n=1 Tax=Geothrix sp. 21YS21S-2 TaxID=3068893 RepID=UPI0027B9E618|nr:HAD-IG family 5'-nucleotidase [Geothrix sp. 21YS21S-2]